MLVPTYDEFIEPLLRFLAANPNGVDAALAYEALAAQCKLDDELREQTLRSGKPVYRSRIQWAHDRLKRGGLSMSSRRGEWRLTPEGLRFAQIHRKGLPAEVVAQLATKGPPTRLRPMRRSPLPDAIGGSESASALAVALAKSRDTVIEAALEMVRGVPSVTFQSFIGEVLAACGYKAVSFELGPAFVVEGIFKPASAGKARSGNMFVQAKQLSRAVGEPGTRAFCEAMKRRQLTIGLFLITSEFNKHALRCVERVPGVRLVGGRALAELMIKHELGITREVIEVPRLSNEYFGALTAPGTRGA